MILSLHMNNMETVIKGRDGTAFVQCLLISFFPVISLVLTMEDSKVFPLFVFLLVITVPLLEVWGKEIVKFSVHVQCMGRKAFVYWPFRPRLLCLFC